MSKGSCTDIIEALRTQRTQSYRHFTQRRFAGEAADVFPSFFKLQQMEITVFLRPLRPQTPPFSGDATSSPNTWRQATSDRPMAAATCGTVMAESAVASLDLIARRFVAQVSRVFPLDIVTF